MDAIEAQFPKWILGPYGGFPKFVYALTGFWAENQWVDRDSYFSGIAPMPWANAFLSLLEIAIYRTKCYQLDILEWSPAMGGVVETLSQRLKDPTYLTVLEDVAHQIQ